MRLSYLKAYGRNGLQGQWWPGDADSRRQPRRTFTEGSGWELSIEAAIAHLLPALGATHALLSVGGMHVPERSPLVEAEFRAWQRAFDNTSVHPTWKTYTRPRDEKDTLVASRYFNVFDAGALVRAHQANKSGVYIDDRGHIDAEANNLINVEMIRQLFVERPSTPRALPGQELRQSHMPTSLSPNTKSSAAPPPADEPDVLSVRSAVQRHGNPLTRTVITTMSNQASRQELLLWAAMLHEHRERHFFVLATDDPVLSTCARFFIHARASAPLLRTCRPRVARSGTASSRARSTTCPGESNSRSLSRFFGSSSSYCILTSTFCGCNIRCTVPTAYSALCPASTRARRRSSGAPSSTACKLWSTQCPPASGALVRELSATTAAVPCATC